MHTLNTPRLALRPWRPADLEPFAALNADPRVMEFMPAQLTRNESDAFAARVAAALEARGFGLWVLELRASFCEVGALAGIASQRALLQHSRRRLPSAASEVLAQQ